MRKFIRQLFRLFGAEINRYRPEHTTDALFVQSLKTHDINVVFDIGSNIGQFGKQIRESGYTGHIVSFEPLSAAYEELSKLIKKDSLWQLAPKMAIGDMDGEIDVQIASNSQSSSILNMLESHKEAEPNSVYIGKEKVPINQLDTIASDYLNNESVLFLKIDTQGYEDRVLNGSTKLMKNVKGLQLEISLIPLYENQLLYDDMIGKLNKLGFTLWSLSPVFHNLQNGKLLQVDATFYRN